MADFSLNGYDYIIGGYDDTTGHYTVIPSVNSTSLTSYQSLTNTYVSIDGVITPMVRYNGNDYIIRSLSYCFAACSSMTSAPTIPSTVINMSYCFSGCSKLNQSIIIPSSVINMSRCFYHCTAFNQPITIPNSVTNMEYCFSQTAFNQQITIPNSVINMSRCFHCCTAFNQPITISNSVIDMSACFYNCTSFNQPITIPNSVTNMELCFYNCASFNQQIVIPSSVTDMSWCFYVCTAFNQPITIPNSVTNMEVCFYGCTSFNQQIVIPSSVTDMTGCFYLCRALNSDIYVLSNQIRYSDAFVGTSEQIILHTYNTALATSNLPSNVVVGTSLIYTMLNSRKLTTTENVTYNTTHGVRVDMLLDTSLSGAIIGSTAPLYDLEDNEIDLSWYNAPNGLLRCYAIIDAPIQVPSSSLVVGVECVAPEQLYGSIGYPCTTESVQIEHNGDSTEILAPYITSENVRFNPKNLQRASNIYNVRDMIALVARESPTDVVGKAFSRVQLNNIENNNVNAQHVVTCADNVYNGSRTVQEVITALYNRY